MWFIKHIKTGEVLNINQDKTSIGRLGTTYVFKNDESISRKHCTFLLKQNELQIIDDGAKYGTTIQNTGSNKVSKEPMTLKDGDKVHFGCFENIWEVHCKHETRGGIKRKSSDVEATENSLSISNIPKKPKENPINAKIVDKFDILIDSDDDMPSKSSRSSRQRKNLINSEDIVPSTSKATENKSKKASKADEKPSQSNKKVDQVKKPQQEQDKVETALEPQKPAKEVPRSQAVYDDSDEDIFSPSHDQKSKDGTNNRKVIIDSDDDLMAFNVPMKAINSRKRPTNDTENGGSNKKIPRSVMNTRNQANNDLAKKVASQMSTKKPSNDEVDKSASRAPLNTSQHSRKRDLDDEIFNFDIPIKHQLKKPRYVKKNENVSSEELTPAASTSISTVKSVSFKTSKITDKEAFASFVYDINEDSSSWLSTRISKINVKDETPDELDNSTNNSINPQYSINVNIVRKNISLDTTTESKKCFQKQKFLESNQVVTLKKLNVQDMNYCYNKKEEELRDDWS